MSEKIAAAYLRVSSKKQAGSDRHSLDDQERFSRVVCEREGLGEPAIYRDAGRSAWTNNLDKLPELRRLLDDVRAGQVGTVIVTDIDRILGRKMRLQATVLETLADAGVRLIHEFGEYDPRDPNALLQMRMRGVFAESESDVKSVKIRRGLAERKAKGLSLASRPPFGYMRPNKSEPDVPAPRERGAVRWLFVRYAKGGVSMQALAETLNAKGFVTREGRPFSEYGVRAIFDHEYYLGGRHKGLVSEALFERVRCIRRERAPSNMSHEYRRYLLKGLLRCALCGVRLWAFTLLDKPDAGSRRGQAVYRHPARSNCKAKHYLSAEKLDAQAAMILFSLTNPLDIERRAEMVARLREQEITTRETLTKQLDAAKAKRRRVADAYADGAYDKATYKAKLADVDREIERLEVEIAGSPTERMARALNTIEGQWADADTEKRRALLTGLFDSFIVLPEGVIVETVPQATFREWIGLTLEAYWDGRATGSPHPWQPIESLSAEPSYKGGEL